MLIRTSSFPRTSASVLESKIASGHVSGASDRTSQKRRKLVVVDVDCAAVGVDRLEGQRRGGESEAEEAFEVD